MAALAYVFPPLSGLAAYVWGSRDRTRWHGLQAVLLGALWPAALVACSLWTPGATQVAFFAGLGIFVLLFATTLFGGDLLVPGLGRRLRAWAAERPTTV
jgi:hypothetical protein